MKTKVTLSLDKDFVERAKKFAKSKGQSLSQEVTDAMMEKMEEKQEIRKKLEIVGQLAGSLKLPKEDVNKPFKQLRNEAYEYKLKKKFGL